MEAATTNPDAQVAGTGKIEALDPFAKVRLHCGTCDLGSYEDAGKKPTGFCALSDCPGAHKEVTVLEAQILKVRELRANLEAKTQEHHLLLIEFNREHSELIESLCKVRNDCSQEDAKFLELTLAAYAVTGDKKPAKGVSVKLTKSVKYDVEQARSWALTENPGFLELDTEAFEAWAMIVAKRKQEIKGLKLEIVEAPQATIAKEL
jgi:hypothetical protein